MAKILTDATFKEELLDVPGLSIVDFYADWCGPCKIMLPTIEELSAAYEGKVNICKLNVDENQQTAMTYQVMTIPTMLFIKNGEVLETLIGVTSKTKLEELIAKHS